MARSTYMALYKRHMNINEMASQPWGRHQPLWWSVYQRDTPTIATFHLMPSFLYDFLYVRTDMKCCSLLLRHFFWTFSKPDAFKKKLSKGKSRNSFSSCYSMILLLSSPKYCKINLLTHCENFSGVWWTFVAMEVCSPARVPLML